MLQYKTLLAESKTPLLLAQKEIASLQKELDGFRKAVDAKAKEKDAMERAAKFAKAETEKVRDGVLVGGLFSDFEADRTDIASMACRPRPRPRRRRDTASTPS